MQIDWVVREREQELTSGMISSYSCRSNANSLLGTPLAGLEESQHRGPGQVHDWEKKPIEHEGTGSVLARSLAISLPSTARPTHSPVFAEKEISVGLTSNFGSPSMFGALMVK